MEKHSLMASQHASAASVSMVHCTADTTIGLLQSYSHPRPLTEAHLVNTSTSALQAAVSSRHT